MANLPRKLQQIFGGNLSATGNIAKFGSLAAAAPAYSLDPDEIQTTAWLNAWAAALINAPGGLASPALQDMNAAIFVITRQLAYLFQKGMPDWITTETYYTNDFVKVAGVVFISKTDNNSGNNPLTDTNNWKTLASTLTTGIQLSRAWVCFDGTTGAIKSAYNVSSVTRNAAGSYVLNFTTPLLDDLYGFSGSCGTPPGTAWRAGDDNTLVGGVSGRTMIKSTSQLSVFCWDRGDGTTQDAGAISVQVFGNPNP